MCLQYVYKTLWNISFGLRVIYNPYSLKIWHTDLTFSQGIFNLILCCDRQKGWNIPFWCSTEILIKRSSSEIKDGDFRSFYFSREVPIRLDYQGKRVDMTHGPLAGLLMGLGQLNSSELRLKCISYRHGWVDDSMLIVIIDNCKMLESVLSYIDTSKSSNWM